MRFRGSVALVGAGVPRSHEFEWAVHRFCQLHPDVALVACMGPEIAVNRNNAARAMQGDWLWCLDDDSIFQPDALERLLPRLSEIDIVAPMCVRRSLPYDVLAYVWGADGVAYPISQPPGSGLVMADQVTTMGALIARSVFERLEEPWFRVGQGDMEHNQDDTDFMRRARLAGIRIGCDTDVLMGHTTRMVVWPGPDDQITVAVGDGRVFQIPRQWVNTTPAVPEMVGLLSESAMLNGRVAKPAGVVRS